MTISMHRLEDSATATLEELEARIAALEASQAVYRAVPAVPDVLAANQRGEPPEVAAVWRELAVFRHAQSGHFPLGR